MLTGSKEMILKKELRWLEVRNLGSPLKGPNHEKRPDKYVRRAIRGMLPWHTFRGRDAFSRVYVYIGVPEEEIKKAHNIDIKTAKIERLRPVQACLRNDCCRGMQGDRRQVLKWKRQLTFQARERNALQEPLWQKVKALSE